MEDTITVLERVWFDKEGKPYLWDRSYDDGETWEVVTSPFAEILNARPTTFDNQPAAGINRGRCGAVVQGRRACRYDASFCLS